MKNVEGPRKKRTVKITENYDKCTHDNFFSRFKTYFSLVYSILLDLNLLTLANLVKSNEFTISWFIKITFIHFHGINQ